MRQAILALILVLYLAACSHLPAAQGPSGPPRPSLVSRVLAGVVAGTGRLWRELEPAAEHLVQEAAQQLLDQLLARVLHAIAAPAPTPPPERSR